MAVKIDPSWYEVLREQFEAPYFEQLKQFLIEERAAHTCYPPGSKIFAAFDHTPFNKVKVVILGQDPTMNQDRPWVFVSRCRKGCWCHPHW